MNAVHWNSLQSEKALRFAECIDVRDGFANLQFRPLWSHPGKHPKTLVFNIKAQFFLNSKI